MKWLLGIFLTFLCLEMLLRAGFDLPDQGAFIYDSKTHLLFNRPEFSGKVPTQRFFQLAQFARTSSKEGLPPLVEVIHSPEGFRQGNDGFRQTNGPGVLLLGDSVSYGWPLPYQDTHLPALENSTIKPVRTCALLAAGPIQLKELLRHYCHHSAGWDQVLLQLTVHSSFSFPDTLFLDNLGADFHGKMAYLSYAPPPHALTPNNWFERGTGASDSVDKFAEKFFIDSLITGTYLEKTLFFLGRNTPDQQAPRHLKKLTENVLRRVPEENRHHVTAQAIQDIRDHLGVPLVVYLHPTRDLALGRAERPDIENLKRTLISMGVTVFDQRKDTAFQHMVSDYYFTDDLHPRQKGYQYFAQKVSELLQLKK